MEQRAKDHANWGCLRRQAEAEPVVVSLIFTSPMLYGTF